MKCAKKGCENEIYNVENIITFISIDDSEAQSETAALCSDCFCKLRENIDTD